MRVLTGDRAGGQPKRRRGFQSRAIARSLDFELPRGTSRGKAVPGTGGGVIPPAPRARRTAPRVPPRCRPIYEQRTPSPPRNGGWEGLMRASVWPSRNDRAPEGRTPPHPPPPGPVCIWMHLVNGTGNRRQRSQTDLRSQTCALSCGTGHAGQGLGSCVRPPTLNQPQKGGDVSNVHSLTSTVRVTPTPTGR